MKQKTMDEVTGENDGASSTSSVMASKKKPGWFHSLTRRKKSQSQTSLTPNNLSAPTNDNDESMQNNNNEPPNSCLQHSGVDECNVVFGTVAIGRKRKEEKGVFQRFAKRIGLRLRFQSLGRNHTTDEDMDADGATTDASGEFVTQTRCIPGSSTLTFTFVRNEIGTFDDPTEMVPFTHDYHRFIAKKWLESENGQNRVMYRACSEMLGQVWYWGEISRKNAQRVLTDKPTGSFLVRDSESSGSQFTLSFRIVNVTLHYRIEHRENYWHFEELQYESIVEMIEDILRRCTNDNFICFVRVPNEMQPPFPVILKYPLSRYFQMPQLQDLCRRVIQRNMTPNEINKLPVPTKLMEYLHEKRELVF